MFASILCEFFRILIRVLAVNFKILQNFKAAELREIFYERIKACDEILKFRFGADAAKFKILKSLRPLDKLEF
ncbi:hypothetical protein [uncultured Campylobacter sp.]|uniref:hypothetical protein n=1 Tax=uncultured Campylobacter sp. TaxID=218934 RepID=UPI00262FD42A|nr:hypothetical protein [uncultured Campylobacter sp.]